MLRRGILLILVLLTASLVFGHEPKLDVIKVEEFGNQRFVSVALWRNGVIATNFDAEFRRRVKILQGGQPLELATGVQVNTRRKDIVYLRAKILGQTNGIYELTGPLRPERPDMTTVLLVFKNGTLTSEREYRPTNSISVPRTSGFFGIGVAHLLKWPDHILFVIALVMAGGGLLQFGKVFISFTVGQLLALGVVVVAQVTIATKLVEAVIPLSLAAVALLAYQSTNAKSTATRHSWNLDPSTPMPPIEQRIPLMLVFGLLHGFCYAGGLIDRGFDYSNVGRALLHFDLGLETAQIGVACIFGAVFTLLGRDPILKTKVVRFFSVCFLLLAGGGFLQRVFWS